MTANCFNGAHRLVSADTAAHICSSAQSEIPAECARDIVSLRISTNTQIVDDAVSLLCTRAVSSEPAICFADALAQRNMDWATAIDLCRGATSAKRVRCFADVLPILKKEISNDARALRLTAFYCSKVGDRGKPPAVYLQVR